MGNFDNDSSRRVVTAETAENRIIGNTAGWLVNYIYVMDQTCVDSHSVYVVCQRRIYLIDVGLP